MAVPVRPQAEAITRPGAIVIALVVLVLAGCGGDQNSGDATEERSGASDTQTTEPAPDLAAKSKPSRRDVEVERDLERHLKQEAGVASGWTYADVEAVHVRGTRTVIETDLPPSRREAGASLCLAARRFSSTSDMTVTGAGRAIIGRC
jgi:hypothetical protein